ncbi:hypothetical protein CCB80_14805 [Armatimonadetes bacterium Uphvl-Ar1]|nr:hypothetical protein CCB80_14805 [Armatimonadetes bacterium Uphvl-Ar1]
MTESYSYDSGDKLLSVTGGSDPRTFAYDAAGRTTGIVRSSGTTAFSYDYESRVTSIMKPGMTTNTFTYNGLDTRVGMTDSSGSKSFKRNGVYVTDPVLSDGTASFTPSGEVRGGVKTTSSSALKNSDIQTNSAQSVVASKVYDAFGNQLSSTGTWAGQFQYAGKFGYHQDPDSGLKLLGHRYYDSSTGRFLTRDPIKDGRNWYSYCGNRSVGHFDEDGLRVVALYKLVDNATEEIMKWGETWHEKTRYTKNWLKDKGVRLEVIAYYDTKIEAKIDERVLESEMPGKWNNTPWAKKAKEKGFKATNAIGMGSAANHAKEHREDIRKHQPDLENIKNTPFLVSEVVSVFEGLGNWINDLGADVVGSRMQAHDEMLSVE